MNMVQNHDLKPAQADVLHTGAGTNIIATAVPAAMRRYVTYIKYNNIAAAQTIEVTDSPTSGDYDATGYTTLDKQKLAADNTIMFPDSPDAKKPIMIIESGHYLVGKCDVGTMQVTAQYYDE
jgi:hypothetical protein